MCKIAFLTKSSTSLLCGSSWSLQGAVRIEFTGKNGDAKVAEGDNEDRRPQGRNADVNSTSNRDV